MLTVRFIDVGQGDAAIISCDGKYMLIDGGSQSQSSKIYTILKSERIERLEYVIASHPDEDHIGGLLGALRYAKVNKFYCTGYSAVTDTLNKLKVLLSRHHRSIEIPEKNTEFKLGEADVRILGPERSAYCSENTSLTVLITFGEHTFLFTGDNEKDDEQELLTGGVISECTVLKVAHHGSKNSCSQAFLQAAEPQYAVISVGKDNAYGHPADCVLEALYEIDGLTVLRTDQRGDITFRTDGVELTVETEREESPMSEEDVTVKAAALAAAVSKDEEGHAERTEIEQDLVANTNTMKFHVPSCGSVDQIKSSNRLDRHCTYSELIEEGYQPCKRCTPGMVFGTSGEN